MTGTADENRPLISHPINRRLCQPNGTIKRFGCIQPRTVSQKTNPRIPSRPAGTHLHRTAHIPQPQRPQMPRDFPAAGGPHHRIDRLARTISQHHCIRFKPHERAARHQQPPPLRPKHGASQRNRAHRRITRQPVAALHHPLKPLPSPQTQITHAHARPPQTQLRGTLKLRIA